MEGDVGVTFCTALVIVLFSSLSLLPHSNISPYSAPRGHFLVSWSLHTDLVVVSHHCVLHHLMQSPLLPL